MSAVQVALSREAALQGKVDHKLEEMQPSLLRRLSDCSIQAAG